MGRMQTDRPMWRSRAWLVAAVVLLVLGLVMSTIGVDSPATGRAVVAVAAALAASVIGWAQLRIRAQRRQYDDELAAWASEQAAQAERLRIAADLHDLVSHGLGLITVRAAAARSVAGSGGEGERADALADIERVGRETTTELRRMLTVLRDPDAAPLRPADTIDDLPAIVEAANRTGLTASLGVDDPGDVSPGVQLTVCAVVREALNNTIRHAGPTQARVGVHRDGEAIVVDVSDAGPHEQWQPQPGAGHGLDGLRERVTALGGTLHAASADPGFRVTARIPDRDRP